MPCALKALFFDTRIIMICSCYLFSLLWFSNAIDIIYVETMCVCVRIFICIIIYLCVWVCRILFVKREMWLFYLGGWCSYHSFLSLQPTEFPCYLLSICFTYTHCTIALIYSFYISFSHLQFRNYETAIIFRLFR